MNSTLRVVSIALLMLMIASVPAIEGNSGGKHNQSSAGCTCHSNAGGVTVGENFPSSYNAGQSYPITIDVNGGTQAFIGGFSLQIDKGTLGNPSPDVQIAGMSATHTNSNQRSFTLDWIAPAANSGTVSVDIAVLNGNGNFQNSGDGWAKTSLTISEIPPLNTPPTASNLALSPRGAVAVDQDLTVSYTFADSDGDAESNTMVRWFVNGTLAPAYNDMTTIAASETSIEETWTVKVTPSDGMDFGPEETCQDQAMIVDIDTDGDGVFDGDDAFPNDASETSDSDGDGVGDNADAFPNDATETTDSDGDSVGDNADAFPNDASETLDSDGNGVGDNAQAAQEAADAEAAEARRNMIIIALIVLALIGGGGAVLFLRRGGSEEEPEKSFEQQSIVAAQPVIASQPVAVAAVAATPVVAAVQPVAEEPTVLRQWTDEAGYTWRAMSDGGNYWWTGTEWKRA